jgi:hypothetical protein
MPIKKEWSFGAHRAHLESPDVLVMTFNGPTTFDETKSMVEIYAEVGSQRPVFLIADVSTTTTDARMRDYISKNVKTEWFHTVIYTGVGFVQKAAAKALAIALYLSGKWKADIEFVGTEQEARAIIERKRQKMKKAA